MDTYTKLNRTGPGSPLSGGVWKIRKKQRADDRGRREEKKKNKDREEKEVEDHLTIGDQEVKSEALDINNEDQQIGYGSAQKKGRTKQKIDLTI